MKTKNIAKKAIAMLLAVATCFNMTACGNRSDNDNDDNNRDNHSNFGDFFNGLIGDSSNTNSGSDFLDADSDGVVNYQELSVNQIAEQCNGCEEAANLYSDLITTAYEFYCDEDSRYAECTELISKGQLLYDAINHSCDTDVIYVEDVPFSIYGSYGFYTGNWQGFGPTGEGSYTGTDTWKGGIVTYDGEWAHGLPEGYGKLYIGNFLGHYWDMDYCGYMFKGMRHGEGTWMESGYGNMNVFGAESFKYRFYENTVFENDIMIRETDYEEYYEDGSLVSYGTMVGDEYGWVYTIESHDPTEMTEAEFWAYGIGITAITIGIVSLLDFGVPEYETPYECTPEGMAEWHANKEAERQAEAQRQAAEEEKNRQWYEDKYYECIDSGDTWSLDYQFFKNMSGN